MKSSTHNQSNLQSIGAEKRLDALVKKQAAEHEHLIAAHCKEMQALRDELKSCMERCESLSQQGASKLNDLKTYTLAAVDLLKDKVLVHGSLISEERKAIESFHEQLLGFQFAYTSKGDAEKLKRDMESIVKDSTDSHLNSFQDLQREVKTLVSSVGEDLKKLRFETEFELEKLSAKSAENFYVSRLDKDGVLNQVRVYEKSMFIIEKKIENIYTLIERINKRGELCPRPE